MYSDGIEPDVIGHVIAQTVKDLPPKVIVEATFLLTTLFDELAEQEEIDIATWLRSQDDITHAIVSGPPDPLEIDPAAIRAILWKASVNTEFPPLSKIDEMLLVKELAALYRKYSLRVANEYWKRLTSD